MLATGTDQCLRVVVVDDHPLYRAGLATILRREPGLDVAGEAANAREALALVIALQPDVFIIDVSLPGTDGITCARDVLRVQPHTRVLVLSMHEDIETVRSAFAAGALGYALKDDPCEQTVEAVRTVARGHVYLSPRLEREPLHARPTSSRGVDALSAREREVFDLLIRGNSNKAVADELCVSIKTVQTHRARINQKLGVHSAAELVHFAAKRGLVRV